VIVGSSPTSNPQGPHRPRLESARETRSESGAGAVEPRTAAADDPSATSSGSSEMAQLLDRLRSLPEVRASLVSRIGEQLERGAYSTREAAEQTAAALLGSRRD